MTDPTAEQIENMEKGLCPYGCRDYEKGRNHDLNTMTPRGKFNFCRLHNVTWYLRKPNSIESNQTPKWMVCDDAIKYKAKVFSAPPNPKPKWLLVPIGWYDYSTITEIMEKEGITLEQVIYRVFDEWGSLHYWKDEREDPELVELWDLLKETERERREDVMP